MPANGRQCYIVTSPIGWVHTKNYLCWWEQTTNHNLTCLNTLRPRQNGRRFADDTFKRIFVNENVWIPIKISLKFVPECPNNNIPALVQIMAWRRPGDKPLSEPMMVSLTTHICITQPQWVNSLWPSDALWFQMSWHASWSTLAQIKSLSPVWCQAITNDYVDQCWLTISWTLGNKF